MNNKMIRVGPTAIGTSGAVTCVATPGTVSNVAGVGTVGTAISNLYYIFRHIRIVNTTSSGISVSGFIAASSSGTTAGREFFGSGLSVAANSYQDWYGYLRMDQGEYLNFFGGGAGLTIDGEGEVGVQ